MINIKLQNNKGFKWNIFHNVMVKGTFTLNKKRYANKKDFNNFDENIFKNKIENINGNFSLIYYGDNKVYVISDKIRSFPLFYTFSQNGDFYLSDNIDWIKKQKKSYAFHYDALLEFNSTGYTTGRETLYENIFQIQAGEMIVYDDTIKKINIKRYFQYFCPNSLNKNISNKNLIVELDKIHLKVFQELIHSLDKKQVVIPLSGGHDSRLIATMLKRLNYENVLCFSYGKKNNSESLISRKVAQKLGYQWHFVEYTKEKWEKWFHSSEVSDFIKYATQYISLPHLQDTIAVNELIRNNIISEDAVFIPGHTYDFLTGGHVIIKSEEEDINYLEAIYKKHYIYKKYHNKMEAFQKIDSRIKIDSNDSIKKIEYWDWQERQAKYICNSVRTYEYFGYKWSLPLWDSQLMDFWLKIPIRLKLNRKLFFEYESSVLDIHVNSANDRKFTQFRKLIPQGIYKAFFRLKIMITDPMATYQNYSFVKKIKYLFSENNSFNATVLKKYLLTIGVKKVE